MKLSRRDALFGALFGGSMLGLRSLATGLPVKLLANPKKAFADMQAQCGGDMNKAQFIILVTSFLGDPISCNAPGTYNDPTTNIDLSSLVHPDPNLYSWMAPTPMSINGGPSYTAAQVWTTLQPWYSRMSLVHMMTNTPVHPKEPQVLELMGATQYNEMFPSVLAKQLAPCLTTLQQQPLSIGAISPSEALTFGGQALPTMPPSALSATLTNQTTGAYAGLTKLQAIRDATLQDMYTWYSDSSQTTPAQKAYIDSMVTSQSQVRGATSKTSIISMLTNLQNDNNGQIAAAVALILMGVTPVIALHFPFGGDNHSDPAFKNEATQHQSGMAALVQLLNALQTNGLQDKVSVLSLNVFGRTMAAYNTLGRQHNQFHQMSMMIGAPFKGGVYGGLTAVDQNGNSIPVCVSGQMNCKLFDFGALPIDPASGKAVTGTSSTAIKPVDQLAAWGMTVMQAVGCTPAQISSAITPGPTSQVMSACLA